MAFLHGRLLLLNLLEAHMPNALRIASMPLIALVVAATVLISRPARAQDSIGLDYDHGREYRERNRRELDRRTQEFKALGDRRALGAEARGFSSGIGARGGRVRGIDTDQDGTVTAEEAAARAERVFLLYDRNRDGVLTEEEAGRQRLAASDTDGDGEADRAEFLRAAKARHLAADTDGDGRVDPFEARMAE